MAVGIGFGRFRVIAQCRADGAAVCGQERNFARTSMSMPFKGGRERTKEWLGVFGIGLHNVLPVVGIGTICQRRLESDPPALRLLRWSFPGKEPPRLDRERPPGHATIQSEALDWSQNATRGIHGLRGTIS